MSEKKRILIVDQIGEWGQEKFFPVDNEVTVVSSTTEALKQLQIPRSNVTEQALKEEYERLIKENSPEGTRARCLKQYLYIWNQENRLKFITPRFDAVLTDLYGKDATRPRGFEVAAVAALVGSPYIGILDNREVLVRGGILKPTILSWIHNSEGWKINIDGKNVPSLKNNDLERFNRWYELLVKTILSNPPWPREQILPDLIERGVGVLPQWDREKSTFYYSSRYIDDRKKIEEIWPGLVESCKTHPETQEYRDETVKIFRDRFQL